MMSSNGDDDGDDRFRAGFRIGFALGREHGFVEGMEAMKRSTVKLLRKLREQNSRQQDKSDSAN